MSGRIDIAARLVEGSRLELTIRDDGIGLPDSNGSLQRKGIGLQNVRSRLAQLYGRAQHFEIGNRFAGGVEARISVPASTSPRPPVLHSLTGSPDGPSTPRLPHASAMIAS